MRRALTQLAESRAKNFLVYQEMARLVPNPEALGFVPRTKDADPTVALIAEAMRRDPVRTRELLADVYRYDGDVREATRALIETPMYAAIVGAPWGHEAVSRVFRAGDEWAIYSSPRLPWVMPARYVFFLNYSRIVPPDVVAAYECVNFHCTKLPDGRGGHPIENLILRGETETVITAHRMTADVDAGPVYCTRGPMSLSGTKAEIHQRLIAPVAEMMRWIIEHEPDPVPQEGEPTYFSRLSAEDFQRVWADRG